MSTNVSARAAPAQPTDPYAQDRHHDARFGIAFEHAPVAMAVVTSREHCIVRANRALTDLLGVPAPALVGRPISDFRDPEEAATGAGSGSRPARPAVETIDLGSGSDASVPMFSGERACVRPDGGTVWFEVHSAVLPDGPDDDPLCLLHLIDITRRKAAETERDRQQAWVSALGEVRLAVLIGVAPSRALALVCERARTLLEASDAVVIVPSRDSSTGRVEAADGRDAERLVGRTVPLHDTLAGEVLQHARVVVRGGAGDPLTLLDGLLPAHGRGAVLALPLRTPEVVMGALCLIRHAGKPFTRSDVDIARSFADQATAALHIGELRADRERLRVMEDRERIARDLHDSVIQDLFAAGMSLESIQPLVTSPRAGERVAAAIDLLDRTIKQIRSTIFDLEATGPGGNSDDLLRQVVESRREQLGFEPKLEVDGDLGNVTAETAEHVLAVVSEGLSNIARHAGASSATVRIGVSAQGAVELTIADDGTGFDPARVPHGNGLDNMYRRAHLLGGSLRIDSAGGGGTRVVLRIPAPGPS